MSGAVPTNYSVLMPAAQVAVFSNHADTHAAVQALAHDWRFARVQFDIRPGDVAHAIHAYAQTPSPNLIMIDTDVIDSSFTALLEQLAGVCIEGTQAIIVGPVNDVALYRYLINLGVGDYLVRPLQTPMIADVIARLLLAQLGASDSHLVAVIGSKGGVGASTVTDLLAYGLAEVKGQKTTVLDFAGGRSYLAVAFGLEPVTTIHEMVRAAVATDPNALQRMVLKAGKQLQIIGTGNDRVFEEPPTTDQIERVLDRLLAVTPYVIADLSGASVAIQKMIISRAQYIMLTSLPTLSSLRLARSLLNEIKEAKGGTLERVHLVLNMSGMAPGLEVERKDIEAALGHRVTAILPFDTKLVVGAESHGKVLGTLKGAEKYIQDLIAPFNLGGARPTEPPKNTTILDQFIRKVGM
jgi:pilus assembly protein CpaE